MTQDSQQVVQTPSVAPEQAPTTEPVQQVVETPKAPPTLLTEERVQQMIAEATAATAKAVVEAKEIGRRDLQRQQEINRREREEAQRRQRMADAREAAMTSKLQEFDPGAVDSLDLARLRAETEERERLEKEDAGRREAEETYGQFKANKREQLLEMGVDPNDKRIDWAENAQTLMEADRRIILSATKIKKEAERASQESHDKRFKDMESKLRRELGLDSVDTSQAVGSLDNSEKGFLQKWIKGEIPATKENIARAKRILED